jgi:hypothetical protein
MPERIVDNHQNIRLYCLNYEREQLEKQLAKKIEQHKSLTAPEVVGCSEVLDRVIVAICREEAKEAG